MIGLCLKFDRARLIRTISNKALFRVDEIQEKKEGKKQVGAELGRAQIRSASFSSCYSCQVVSK